MKPIIYISHRAYQKMKLWVEMAKGEISWLGSIVELKDNRGIITEKNFTDTFSQKIIKRRDFEIRDQLFIRKYDLPMSIGHNQEIRNCHPQHFDLIIF